MPGPAPKDPSLRARRNKTSTASKLSAEKQPDTDSVAELRSSLPPRVIEVKDGDSMKQIETTWHPLAVALWEDVWDSPMAGEYLDADVHGLFVLVALTDSYWRRVEAGQVSGANELAKEIRLQRQAFGLSPIDRRRLQWEVDRGEEAEGRRKKRDARRPDGQAPPTADPRLSLVQ